jgi:hypothetical protein
MTAPSVLMSYRRKAKTDGYLSGGSDGRVQRGLRGHPLSEAARRRVSRAEGASLGKGTDLSVSTEEYSRNPDRKPNGALLVLGEQDQ